MATAIQELQTGRGEIAFVADQTREVAPLRRGLASLIGTIEPDHGEAIGALFPNIWHQSQKVQKGKTYKIPDENSQFRFKIAGPAGKEYVKAIATLEPVLDSAEKALKPSANRAAPPSSANSKQIVVEMKETLDKESSSNWAETTISFTVEDK